MGEKQKRRPGGGGAQPKVFGGHRVEPFYFNPFHPAMPIGPIALAVVAEIDRRMATLSRVRRAAHG